MDDSPVPTSARVIGILAIIFSSLGLISGLTNLGALVFWRSIAGFGFSMAELPAELPTGLIRGALLLGIVGAIGGLAANAVGLAGGTGLLRRRSWSLSAMNVYAVGTIVISLGSYIGSLAVAGRVADALRAIPEVGMNPGVADAIRGLSVGIGGFLGFIGVIFGSAFPVVVLILLNRDAVRQAYQEE